MNWSSTPLGGVSWITLLTGGLISGLILVVIFVVYRAVTRRAAATLRNLLDVTHKSQQLDRLMEEYTKLRLEARTNTLEEIIEQKRLRFQNITGISFHFVDREAVLNFYSDTFREPTIESLVTELVGELNGEIKVGLPKILESKLGGKDVNKWISTIKLPDTSLPGMFARYQREAIKRGEVTLGLEELDIEVKQVDEFTAAIANLNKSFGFTLAEGVVESHVACLKRQAAETMVAKLEKATGWILIEGKFKIETRDNMYKCAYAHPVNEFISENSNITISFSIPANRIEPLYAGNYVQSVGREIPMRVFGNVWQPVSRNANIIDLVVTPLAVYS